MSLIDKIDKFQEQLFEAAEALRGAVSATEYANHVLPLVFLKYISDLNRKYKIEQWEEKKREDGIWLWSRLAKIFPESVHECLDFYYIYNSRQRPGVGIIINEAFRNIEITCPEEFKGVFSITDYDSNRLGNASTRSIILANLLDAIHDLDFSNIPHSKDYKNGDFFSIAIETFAAQNKGELRVPPIELNRLVAILLAATGDERIYDPSCGTGSLLISCATHSGKSIRNIFRIVGLERNGASWSLAKMNAFVHAENSEAIKTGYIPERTGDRGIIGYFDVAVSFPPWGLKDDLYPIFPLEIFQRFLPSIKSKLSSEYSSILHMLSVLNTEHGRLGVLLPTGSLSKAGTERFVRQRLIEENYVDAVIDLPDKIIPGISTRISLVILLIKRTSHNVLFINATKDSKSLGGPSRLATRRLQEITDIYHERNNQYEGTRLASLQEIIENDFSLNGENYYGSKHTSAVEDIKNLQAQRNSIITKLAKLNDEITTKLEKLGFL